MAENQKVEAKKKSWWKGVKAEFKKIIWTKRDDLIKETTAVVVVSVLLGLIISIVDALIKYGIDFIIR